MDRQYSKWDIDGMISGFYGTPPSTRIWFRQLAGFLFCLFWVKVVVVILLQLKFLSRFAEWLLKPISDPHTQLIVVMLIFPLAMNILQFWLVDGIIRNDVPDHDPLTYESNEAIDAVDRRLSIDVCDDSNDGLVSHQSTFV
eukprot:Partr_v1_DN28855_c0_g1_i1_m33836 putative Transmembrane protein 110